MSSKNHNPSDAVSMRDRSFLEQRSFVGTGLRAPFFFSLVALSSGLFFLWPSPIWSTPAGDSHVARFAVSYAIVIPVAAVLLVVTKGFTTVRWVTATFVAWGAKLVITATAYLLLANGGGMMTDTKRSRPVPRTAVAAPKSRLVRGHVTPAPTGLAFAYVVGVEATPDAATVTTTQQVISNGKFSSRATVVSYPSRLTIDNEDSVFYRVELLRVGSVERDVVANAPMPPKTRERSVDLPGPGLFHLVSDSAGGQLSAFVFVRDAVQTVAVKGGRFEIELDVNEHPTIAVVTLPEGRPPQWTTKRLHDAPSGVLRLSFNQ